MKRVLSLCFFILLLACTPAQITADADPTPFPVSLIESVLGQYLNCSWDTQGLAYFFTGPPYDSDIFAARYDGENYIFDIITVADGKVQDIIESNTAIFQEPVTGFYMEVDDEINIFFESGSSMLYQRDMDKRWKLTSYTKCAENDRSFSVSIWDGPLTFYSCEDPAAGTDEEGVLCGRLDLDNSLESVHIHELPTSVDVLKAAVTSKSPSEWYLMDRMRVEDVLYFASCRCSAETADIRIYTQDEIARFDEDALVRVMGYDVYVDDDYWGRVDRQYNAQYDVYYGNTDILVDISAASDKITIVPCWDDGTADPVYSFVFPIE